MIQLVVIGLILALLLGLVGIPFHDKLEEYLVDLWGSPVNFSEYHEIWEVAIGYILVFLIPLSVFVGLYIIYNRNKPEKIGTMTDRSKNLMIALVFILGSFFIYNGVAEIFNRLPEFLIASVDGFTGVEDIFYSGSEVAQDISIWNIGDIAVDALIGLLLNGLYTLALMSLIATLVVRNVLVAFGVVLFPISVYIYAIPFSLFDSWAVKTLKQLIIVLLLPTINIVLLALITVGLGAGIVGDLTQLIAIVVMAGVNYGMEKRFIFGMLNVNPRGVARSHRRRKYKAGVYRRRLSTGKEKAGSTFGKIKDRAAEGGDWSGARPSLGRLRGGSSSGSSGSVSSGASDVAKSFMRNDAVDQLRNND